MKSIRSLALLGAILAVAVVASARAQEKKDEQPTTEYYPTKVGTSWTYKLGENKFTMRVAKADEINKQPCVKVEMVDPQGKVMASEHVQVKSDGVYRLAFEGKAAEPGV